MKAQLTSILEKTLNDIKAADTFEALDSIRVKYLGKKGELTAILKQMGKLDAEMRPVIGALANEVRQTLEASLEEAKAVMTEKATAEKLAREALDVTMPGTAPVIGKKHPTSIVLDEICDIFTGIGFTIADGPEVELDYYNFEALNNNEAIIEQTKGTGCVQEATYPYSCSWPCIPFRRSRRNTFPCFPSDRRSCSCKGHHNGRP